MTTITMPKKSLTFLITGCSSGFGLSLTRIVQANGHKVIATSRNPSRTPELVSEVESHGGRWFPLDVNSLTSNQLITSLEESGEKIDVLVNNAGYSIFSTVETSTEEEIRAQMETMYFGPLRLIRAVLPFMRERKGGVIVNFSSGASLEGQASMGPYAGAKAALDGITKVLAKEIACFNIQTLTVILGGFNTNMGAAAVTGTNPLPEAYRGTIVDKFIQSIMGGLWIPGGDKEKAMKAVYEVIVGEGAGAGREAEKMLPLGTDMTIRVKALKDYLAHSLEAFAEITNDVGIDK